SAPGPKAGRYRLARADAQPVRHWPVTIAAEPDGNIGAVVGVRGELCANLPIVLVRGVCDLGGLWAVFAGGWLALRHLDVVLDVHSEGGCRERDTGDTGASDYCRDDGAPALAGSKAPHIRFLPRLGRTRSSLLTLARRRVPFI